MKRILFVINQYPVVSETFINDQIKFFRDKGCNVSVLCHSYSSTINEVSFFETKLRESYIRRLLSSIFVLLNTGNIKLLNFLKYGRNSVNQSLLLISDHFSIHNDYDLIYCHFGRNGKFICQLKEAGIIKAQTKVAVHFHGIDLNIHVYNKDFYKPLNKHSDAIIVGSDLAIEHLKKLDIYTEEKVIKTPVSLDLSKFPKAVVKEENILKIVTVGRLIDLKGHIDAIEVVKEFKKRSAIPFHYSIVGDGPLKDLLKRMIYDYGLEQEVNLIGALDHNSTLKLMSEADVYLYCGIKDKDGRQEMQGLAVVEAMASRCTVISSSIGGVKEYLTDRNGFLCPPGNINCFVEKLIIAATDKSMVTVLKENAYNTAIETFDRDKNYRFLLSKLL